MQDEWNYDVWAQEYEEEAKKVAQKIKELKPSAKVGTQSERCQTTIKITEYQEIYHQLIKIAEKIRNWGKPT